MSLFTKKPLIQIAGFHNESEVLTCLRSGATHVGFPLGLDVHSEDITAEEVGAIVRKHNLQRQAVLITYAPRIEQLSKLLEATACGVVQAHGEQSIEVLSELRQRFVRLEIIKSIVIGGQRDWQSVIEQYESVVDAFITDTFDPVSGASGATGKTHDWNISAEIVRASTKPVIIAGGLNANNVGQAIQAIRPAGVDAHTGVENSAGFKSASLVERFCIETKNAFRNLK